MGTPEATLSATKKQKKSPNLLLHLLAQNLEKGVEIGVKKGEEIGMEKGVQKTILAFLKKTPQITDEEAAELFEVPLVDIKNLRSQIQP